MRMENIAGGGCFLINNLQPKTIYIYLDSYGNYGRRQWGTGGRGLPRFSYMVQV